MQNRITIVGGGIGGMATALALARAGQRSLLLERASAFSEVGAGIQLGPNVVRLLRDWGLMERLKAVAHFPQVLRARHALSGAVLGEKPLGSDTERRYGAPYATIARADMHGLLVAGVSQAGSTEMRLGQEVTSVTQDERAVHLQVRHPDADHTQMVDTKVLVGADGVWSRVRANVMRSGGPRQTGHLAYRAMVPMDSLPLNLRPDGVTAWLGPDFHVVQYPVRAGEWLNVVAIVHGDPPGELSDWDHSANATDLQLMLGQAHPALRDLIYAIPQWRLWALCDRPPMRGPEEHGLGRVVLVGDAAHPMRPYLAQGACMAIEDAHALARHLSDRRHAHVHQALAAFSKERWPRNARVQARSIRNGEIYHAKGVVQMARDIALRVAAPRLMDVPWLYRST
ncbi:FAD-dependent monooxygenase [Curvibacter sp. APW13]|uniref:FAD-dependent monooxygenase n=1 Tax=Curvibacter sp. APW13 TaxID=3077236 RepID=UPI0028DDE242|nr:FAD-dependent monooxygenase [Curvibacter sp. APW13]MDT8991049.1 FAD-dependent monooxygenase [Curvibacter sp. APW13]